MGLSISISNSILSNSMAGGISPVNLSPPVISGIGLVGETLSSTLGTWSGTSPISYSYQWKRNGSPILGAISSTYLLVAADADTNITCTVTATNTVGSMSSNSNSISVIGYDPSAYAFFQATGITDPAIKDAVDILVTDLKGYGIWDKMKAIYPFVGGTPTTHKFNLKDPRDLDIAFRLSFNGGWTHSSNGATPNGTNGYANTYFNPFTNSSLSSNSFGIYSRTSDTAGNKVMGVFNAAFTSAFQINLSAGSMFNGSTSSLLSYTASPTTGLILSTRTSTTLYKGFRNNVSLGSNSTLMTLLPNANFYLGARNDGGSPQLYNSYQHAFAFLGDGLTDDDSANLYYSVQKFQTTLGRQVGTPIYSSNATDVNARLFLGATNIQDATITNAVDTLVQGLKTDGVWSKLKAIYPFVGGTPTTHKFNLANALDEDTAFRLAFSGGITHTSNGVQGNGVNGYANTFISPSTNLGQNSVAVNIYSRTNVSGNADFGGQNINGYLNLSSKQYFKINQNTSFSITTGTTASLGLFSFIRTNATQESVYKNGSLLETFSKNSITPSATNLAILGLPFSVEFGNKQQAFTSIGDGLTPTEVSNLYTRVQAFQTTLNRQV
jgi:hypothetical protein